MSSVILSRDKRVAIVELNRPEALNAINIELRRELLTVLDEVARDQDIGAVMLTGAGRGFCTGSDLKRAASDTDSSARRVARTMLHDFQPIFECLTRMDKPVIAAVNGPAVGIGMSIALACDFLVMASDAYLLAPFTNMGLIPDGGAAWFMTRRVGYAPAMEILMEAQKIDATRCLSLGLASRIFDATALREEALSWATRLAARAPLAIALTKRIGRMSASIGLSDALTLEAELQTFLFSTDDCREALAAFSEKRSSRFTGQ